MPSPAHAATETGHGLTVTADIGREEWDRFVDGHPAASRYHAWVWREIVERAFALDTVYLGVRSDRGLAGVLPLVMFRSRLFGRFAVSLPFVDAGGVCADDDAAALALVGEAGRVMRHRGLSFVELRHSARRLPALPVRSHKVGMTLALAPDVARVWTTLDNKARNQVRKAQKSNLSVDEGGAELLPRFYDVFARNMRDLGTPVYPRRFFEVVFECLGTGARVFVVRQGDRPVAAAVALAHGHEVAVPWASSLRAYRALCPNYLLYWHMIEWAVGRGACRFDFGRSTPGEGTYQHKRHWGAQPAPLYWEYCLAPGVPLPNLSPGNPKYQLAIALWQRLPLALTRVLGPRIVRSLP